jgi:GAF domain-containing protein
MAKAQKSNTQKKTAQNNIHQRIKNLFAEQDTPTYLNIRQTEELKARLHELEAKLAGQQAESIDQKLPENQESDNLTVQVAELKAKLGEPISKEAGTTRFVRPASAGNIRTKLVIAFIGVALIAIAIMGFATYTSFRNQIREDIRQRLLNIASIAALQHDGNLHASITGPDSMSEQAYQQMMAQDISIIRTAPDLIYIYTMRMNEQGQIYFVIDARQEEDYDVVDVGTIYEEPSAFLLENFTTLDHPAVEEEFYTDEWGTLLSAYAPFYKADGTREGLVGVDIAADKVLEQERKVLYQILGTTLAVMFVVGGLGLYLGTVFTRPITNLSSVAQRVAEGDLNARAIVESHDEIGTLAITFNNMTSQLKNLVESLEQRVAERTQDLEIASEVGRAITEKVASQYEMLAEAVKIIRERFNLYYVQIYLVDQSGRNLVLRAGTDEVGKQLMRKSHYLPIGLGSVNGRAASEKQAVVIKDTEKSSNFLPNPLLPLTRSEMSVPLMVGDKVVGVLDMQSERPGSLNETNLPAFTALAGQLAVAIQNASLFTQTAQARAETEEQSRRLTAKGWQEFLDGIQRSERIGFSYAQEEVIPLVEVDSAPAQGEDMLVTPIELAGAKIGEICLEDEPGRAWTASENEIIQATAAQVAQHIENLRLLAQAERYRVEAEQSIRRLTRESWDEYLHQSQEMQTGFLYDGEKVSPVAQPDDLEAALSCDIKVHGEPIGQLSIVGADVATLSVEEQELITSVTERLSAHIENLRLSAQTEEALAVSQKLAQREQALRQVTAAVRSSTNLETILRTTAREVGSILGRQTIVRLTPLSNGNQAESVSEDGLNSPAKQS